MCKRLAFLVMALGFCFSPAARAINVTWVTESVDITGDGVPDDFAWIPWLQSLGHTVDVQRGNWTALDSTKIAALNAADVIIISRSATSGNYNTSAAMISQWSGIKTPIINLHAYFVRNSRWFWVNTATINSLVGPMMEVVVPTHAIFTGIKLNAANQVAVVDGTTGTGQTSFIGSTDVGSGTLLAKTGTNAWVVEWQPGKPFYTGSSETPAGKRMLFSAGTQETAPQPQGAFNLTEDGKKMLNNAILYMAGKSIVEGLATNPKPAKGQTDVPFDVTLSWTAGKFAKTHDVYIGLSSADVNNASRTKPSGVLASQNQSDTSFAPTGLQFGQTYYWRVDEVNTLAGNPIVKGETWSFTVEPFAYPLANVTATASSSQVGMGPEKTVDGSGMTGDQHGTDSTTMWMSRGTLPNWIQYQFDKVYKLSEMWVWNSNQIVETFVGFGAKDVKVEYSTDGSTWTQLQGVPPFAQATGAPAYAHNTTVNLGGVLAKYIKLTINGTWGGLPQTGLAEVRFFYVPVQAREPQPAAGATGVNVSTTMNWRPGREATSHKVYFGTDPNAVANGTATAKTVTGHTFDAGALAYGTTFYWKVDEVGAAATYPGQVWSFTTQEFAVVEDFESYNDTDNRIYDTWIDGMADNNSGSVVGYLTAPFAEKTIVHGGAQSMPMAYNNAAKPYYSETNRQFSPAQDLTFNGATSLGLWFRGYPAVTSVAVTETAGKITLTGDGTDIWNNSDDFVFAYKTLTGDGSMIARVTSIGTGTNTWAKAGVMVRDSLNGGSTHAAMYLSANSDGTAGNGYSFQRRLTTDGASSSDDGTAPAVAPPYWVKIQRAGDIMTGSISADGKTWRLVGSPQTIAMTAPVYIGLCATSHAAGEQRTFQFDSVSTTGNVSGQWQGAQINSPRYNDAAGLYAVVLDSTGKSKLVTHPDPAAAATGTWTLWTIPLSDLTSAGVKVTSVKNLTLGVGSRSNPQAGGAGMLYIDDIGYGKPAAK